MNQHHSTTIIISFKNDFNKIVKKINTAKKPLLQMCLQMIAVKKIIQ